MGKEVGEVGSAGVVVGVGGGSQVKGGVGVGGG